MKCTMRHLAIWCIAAHKLSPVNSLDCVQVNALTHPIHAIHKLQYAAETSQEFSLPENTVHHLPTDQCQN